MALGDLKQVVTKCESHVGEMLAMRNSMDHETKRTTLLEMRFTRETTNNLPLDEFPSIRSWRVSIWESQQKWKTNRSLSPLNSEHGEPFYHNIH